MSEENVKAMWEQMKEYTINLLKEKGITYEVDPGRIDYMCIKELNSKTITIAKHWTGDYHFHVDGMEISFLDEDFHAVRRRISFEAFQKKGAEKTIKPKLEEILNLARECVIRECNRTVRYQEEQERYKQLKQKEAEVLASIPSELKSYSGLTVQDFEVRDFNTYRMRIDKLTEEQVNEIVAVLQRMKATEKSN